MKLVQILEISIIVSMIVSVMALRPSVKNRHYHKKLSLTKSEDHPLYKLIPKGCYGQKHLQDIRRMPHSVKVYKHKPITPEWCSENEFLVPKRMKALKVQTSAPPYHIHVYEFRKSKNIFRVLLKSEHSIPIDEAILVARPIGSSGMIDSSNIGRFLPSPGVNIICCSLTDKDVAKFQSNQVFVDEVVFYWTPHEEITDDFDGRFIIIATVAKNSKEYWINITSKPMNVVSTSSKMFDVNNLKSYIKE